MLGLDKSRTIKPGDEVLRADLHAVFGGQTQSRISPAPNSGLVMLFSDYGRSAHPREGWHGEHYHYTGEGPRGDQEIQRGNKVILNQAALHLFLASERNAPVIYVGQFACDGQYALDAPEAGSDALRRIWMFKLRPIHAKRLGREHEVPKVHIPVRVVPVSAEHTDHRTLQGARALTAHEQRAEQLRDQYRRHLESKFKTVYRHRIQPAGEAEPFFSDLYVEHRNLLVQACGSVAREALRQAVGQLLDCARFIKPRPAMAVLVPGEVRADLEQMLHAAGIGLVIPGPDGYREISGITGREEARV